MVKEEYNCKCHRCNRKFKSEFSNVEYCYWCKTEVIKKQGIEDRSCDDCVYKDDTGKKCWFKGRTINYICDYYRRK